MSVFRPSNINKRLVGTSSTLTVGLNAGSPGNAGQIGPTKTPYCFKGVDAGSTLSVGQRFCGGGSANGGVFRINESRCGRKENCQCPGTDFKGFFICCGPSTTKWFVAPACTEVTRNWYNRGDAVTLANSCMGSCGWFVPEPSTLNNPGYCCRINWENYNSSNYYWSNVTSGNYGCVMCSNNGNFIPLAYPEYGNRIDQPYLIRAFRCTST